MRKLIGPFKQILTLNHLPDRGSIKDDQLMPLLDAGILINDGHIEKIGSWTQLKQASNPDVQIQHLPGDSVALPGFIDAHTHLCFAGSREKDYSRRLVGASYGEIARQGGGIINSVTATREATQLELFRLLMERLDQQMKNGITTCEIKSGYGLNLEDELKILRSIKDAGKTHRLDIIATCLAAHVVPTEYRENRRAYLDLISTSILPKIVTEKLSQRVDIFIEEGAFHIKESKEFLLNAKEQGFDLCVHADQFTIGGSGVAIQVGARSADHLEASGASEIARLAKSDIVSMVLPGASLGLGLAFAPARKLLDAGAILGIASDWNPGSAPMGDLLVQASLLAIYEKLSNAEVFAGITYQAARALGLDDRGKLHPGMMADLIAFPTDDYRNILYHQGLLKPYRVWKEGREIWSKDV